MGDILVRVGGKPVANTAMMLNLIAQLTPGTPARFGLVRDGKELEMDITVGKRPRAGQQE